MELGAGGMAIVEALKVNHLTTIFIILLTVMFAIRC
jgi:hypothetical protein